MFLPLGFLTAWLIWTILEFVQEPPLPHDGNQALPVLCLAIAAFLLFYALATLVEVVSRRLRHPDNLVLRSILLVRWFLPLIFYTIVLIAGRWDAYARFEFASGNLFLYSVLCISPYLGFELLSVLGEILLRGHARDAVDRIRATWLVAPILLLVVGLSAAFGLHPLTRAAFQELSVVRYVTWGIGFALALVLLPTWLVVLFRTRRVAPPAFRAELDGIAQRAGVRVAAIDELETEGRSLNAAVVGTLGWTRRVLLTDLLLARFHREQVRAVVAHEIAHVKRHHGLRQVLFFVLLPLTLGGWIASFFPDHSEDAWLFAFVGVVVLLLPVLRWLRHRYEHEADLFGARFVGTENSMISALQEVAHTFPHVANRSGMFHPSTRKRIDFLERAAVDRGFLDRWFGQIFRVQAFLFLLLGAGIVAITPSIVRESKRGWPSFLLAAGYPENAYEAWLANGAPAAGAADPDLATRALLIAYDLEPGPGSVHVLQRRALRRAARSLDRRDWRAGLGWYGLARRWGDCGEAIDAMYFYLAANEDSDREAMDRAKALLDALPLPKPIRRAVGRLPTL